MDRTSEWHRMDAERERAGERRWNEYRFSENFEKVEEKEEKQGEVKKEVRDE